MKKITQITFLCMFFMVSMAMSQSITITHNAAQTLNGGGVACFNNVTTIYQEFDLWNDFNVTDFFTVSSVQVGIGPVTSGTQHPVTVNLYSNTQVFPNGSPSLLGSASYTLTNADSFSVISIPLSTVVPPGVNLLYEVIADQTGSGTMRFETNIDGHGTAESWIESSGCNFSGMPTLTSLGLPNNAWVMSVIGTLPMNPPVISCTGNISTNTDLGQCGATITFPDATATNFGAVVQTMGPPSGSLFPIGTTVVEFTATNSGGTDTCQFSVIITDNELPTAICQDITLALNANGSVPILAGDIDNGSTDNCGIDAQTISRNSFTCSDLGTNSVTLTVFDASGNSASCIATVTVVDLIAPVANCQDITVALDANGNASILAGDIDNGSTDNCGIATQTLNTTSFTCNDLGANSVTLTVSDASGNTSSCTATVTIVDLIAPIANCQDITITLDTNGNASILAGDIDNGSTDNCGIDTITADITSFTCSDAGTNAVTLTVTDVSGNSSSCVATVTVIETTAPVATCQDITVALDANGNASILTSEIDNGSTDNCGIDTITADITSFTCSDLGANTVTLTVTDASGNAASCVATVTVVDLIAPVAICQDITVALDANGNASILAGDIDNGSTDNCGIASQIVNTTSFTCSDLGANSVTLTVSDSSGNASSCVATVTVVDLVAPIAICQDITVALDVNGNAAILAGAIDNGSTDNCGIDTVTIDTTSFNCSSLGTNTVTLTVSDLSGNSSSCTATVTIVDLVVPFANCQDVTLSLDANGNATLDVTDVNNGSSDSCGIDGISLSQTTFTCNDIGTNTVTLTVTDTSGNTTSCTATITIEDTLEPSVDCPLDQIVGTNSGLNYVLPDYFGNGTATAVDNCTDPVVDTTQNPAIGTALPDGVYTITLTATDDSGNTSMCTFELTVDETLGVDDVLKANALMLFPNPSEGIVNIGNPEGIQLEKLMIYDFMGRLVAQMELSEVLTNYEVNVAHLQSGSYIMIIQSNTSRFVKQLVKN